MHKRRLHHLLVLIREVPRYSFLVATVLLLLVHAFALRANNQRMLELRDKVFVADEQNGDVEGALKDLRQYVYGHMNTDLAAGNNAIRPPIQLKYTYERLVEAEQAKLQTGNGDLYTEAQAYCEQRFPGGFSGSNRLPCIRDYLDSHGATVSEEIVIPDDLYKFDFATPRWSPDLAGWSLVLAVLSGILLGFRLITEYLIRQKLRG